jgi:hypothetical protein
MTVAVAVLLGSAGLVVSAQQPSFYDIQTLSLDGKPGNLAQYKGKVSLVVNVASKCGFTPQYEGLEKLQREMKGKGSTCSASRATTSVARNRVRRRRLPPSAGSPTT